ncbi:hypothetical protein IMG5_180640 [Ichthyophthirius multifiliis]|uniref:Transmembrane protein n=1 Tax=Ichthyophthirius multifiliis TaxID=5932 RepID=G0R2R1_ICHMU|nr:hypothetical protein IMG5_180640 [Ichthyophthirius multifiliis]EGR28243.1 hypothetical protein IMG5_180640 [Ichthyophthirius multifiliis]|eukprot:XP_004027588.1 hypothetical protein IMG5_180640 [Ichthyophthirius multifiliis]
MNQKLIFILSTLFALSIQIIPETDIQNIEPIKVQLDDVILTGWPNQALELKFDEDLYDIYSIQLTHKLSDGTSLVEEELDNDKVFKSQDLKNLGGCRTHQSKATIDYIFRTTADFQNNNPFERFKDVLLFEQQSKIFITTNTFRVYQLTYSSITSEQIDDVSVDFSTESNFYTSLNPPSDKLTEGETSVIQTSAIQYQNYGFIFCKYGAVRFNAIGSTSLVRNDFIAQKEFIQRTNVNSVYKDEQNYVYVVTSEGIDIYTIDESFSLKQFRQILLQDLKKYHLVQRMDIQQIQVVQQDDITLILLLEKDFGIHVLQNINYNVPWVYRYFILLKGIQSFDATGYTIGVVMHSKNYKFGLELFFDYSTYIQNYIEDNELEVSSIKLDPNSRVGIWMSEDIGKVFSHSILNQNLQANRNNYENYFQMQGDTQIQFLKYNEDTTYIFALGRKYLELYELIKVPSRIICSSSESLLNHDYQIVFHSTKCEDKDFNKDSEDVKGVQRFFQMCEVSMNLKYKTKQALVDSGNLGVILGVLLPFLFILMAAIIYYGWRYQNEKKAILVLESDKRRYYESVTDNNQ